MRVSLKRRLSDPGCLSERQCSFYKEARKGITIREMTARIIPARLLPGVDGSKFSFHQHQA
jgi:hypothetical protein